MENRFTADLIYTLCLSCMCHAGSQKLWLFSVFFSRCCTKRFRDKSRKCEDEISTLSLFSRIILMLPISSNQSSIFSHKINLIRSYNSLRRKRYNACHIFNLGLQSNNGLHLIFINRKPICH